MNNIRRAFSIAVILYLAFGIKPAFAQSDPIETTEAKFSYAVGVQLGFSISQQLSNFPVGVDVGALILGISDLLEGAELRMTADQMDAIVIQVREEASMREQQQSAEVRSAGEAFRAEYANRENVQSTDSGILYTIVEAGSGGSPGPQSTVTVHYRGTLVDGTEFDSSYRRNQPTTFALNAIIPGWQEALQLMAVGAKFEIVLPPELAYGDSGAPPTIPPGATLIFEIELLNVQ